MKKLNKVLLLLMLVLSACVKNEEPAGGYISAVMEGEQTKTAVTDEGRFTWSSGDNVWLGTTSGGVTGILSAGAGTSKAEFAYGTFFGELTGKAVYPYNPGHAIKGNVLSVALPASYDLGTSLSNTNTVMCGVNIDGTFQFSHLAGVMSFKFKNVPAGTDRFQITLDKKVNGTFVVDLDSDQPVVEAGAAVEDDDKTITLNFTPLQTTSDISLYVPLPVGTYTSIALDLWAGEQSVWSYSNTVTNTINRKTLKLMPTITLGGTVGGDIVGGDTDGGADDELSRLVSRINADIDALKTIVTAAECDDYVISAVQTNGACCTITFSQSGSATLDYGELTLDVSVPVIGVQKDAGVYYWTLNGILLRDLRGNLVPVVGNEGQIPQLKINDNVWYLSSDNGSNWERVAAVGEAQSTRVPYTLVHGNRYSTDHITATTRATIMPYTVVVPAGVTIKPIEGYEWGWYKNVNVENPHSSTLGSSGWVTATYTGTGAAIGVTIKKKTSVDFDFSVDSSNPTDYFEVSDPSIWYYQSDASATDALVFKAIDVSNQYYVLITMCDGTVFQIKTKSAIEQQQSSIWFGKKMTCVGDSITAGSGTTKTYWQIMEENLGLSSMTGMGVAGSCVSAQSDYKTNNSPLINRYSKIPDSDIITIFMGTNDYGHETPLGSISDSEDVSFYGALNVAISGIIAAHPDAFIAWITPMHRYGRGSSQILGTPFTYDYLPNGRGHTLGDYVDAIKNVCEKYSIPVVDLFSNLDLDPSIEEIRTKYMPDGLHPNAAGHEQIAIMVTAQLESLYKAWTEEK